LGEREIRESLDTRNWDAAHEIIRQWEADGHVTEHKNLEPITIVAATSDFVTDARARELKERTIYKYDLTFRQLQGFAETQGVRYLKQLDPQLLRKFRSTWKDHNLAALKKLDRLRAFFRFCASNGWIQNNPAKELKPPLIRARQTQPFSTDEIIAILAAATSNVVDCHPSARNNARRLHALILLLRYSGLRIGDAVGCERNRLLDGKLRLYTQKTGTHIHVPLPDFVIAALGQVPPSGERYWFWTGNGKLQTAVADFQARLDNLAVAAKVPNLHAHRFRDSFAVALLLEGVPIERVSILLGHTSTRITERHYAPWVRERQEQAEADVRRTWQRDPVALMETKGTPQVHGKRDAPN
jgi:integrase/recombinase XerD